MGITRYTATQSRCFWGWMHERIFEILSGDNADISTGFCRQRQGDRKKGIYLFKQKQSGDSGYSKTLCRNEEKRIGKSV